MQCGLFKRTPHDIGHSIGNIHVIFVFGYRDVLEGDCETLESTLNRLPSLTHNWIWC